MKKKISLTSSSFLINESSIWNSLRKSYQLNFNEYRFYDQILKQESDFDVVILNFKDLVNYPIFDISLKNKKQICNKIEKIFYILKKKISLSRKPLILFIDYYYSDTKIKSSQNFPLEEKIISFLINKIKNLFKFSNFFYFNIDIFKMNKNLFDNRLFYISKTRYSENCLRFISKITEMTLERIQRPPKKVLILDCDNTLWGGVVGEDGYNNIRIGTDGEGSIFSDLQKSILRLKNEGVILCIVSKNNLTDILEAFNKNKNMILKLKDFTSIKANWKTKTQNIKELTSELGLSLESMAFFDDNPIERDQVKKNLKDVKVIDPDTDISNWSHQIFEIFEFVKFKLTKEDLLKTHQYEKRSRFIIGKNKINNELSFLKQIKLKAKIVKVNKSNEQRALQMIHKTNQFNLTTKRYSLLEISNFKKKKNNNIFMVRLNDKYGDHGLISLVMLIQNANFIYIDTFLMSCRVLGRYLEQWILSEIVKFGKKNKIEFVVGEYVPSKKNILAKELYEKYGFKKITNFKDLPNQIKKNFLNNSEVFIARITDIKLIKPGIYLN
jgi:FkbH-like protein